jgi:hypothetical protein
MRGASALPAAGASGRSWGLGEDKGRKFYRGSQSADAARASHALIDLNLLSVFNNLTIFTGCISEIDLYD